VAVVRELGGDTHPIDGAGAIGDAIVGLPRFAPMRLMSDSVLHFSDNRFGASGNREGFDRPRVEIQRGEMEADRVAWVLAVPLPARFRLIRWIRGFIDSAHRVVARTGPATLRTVRLAAVLEEDLDRAVRKDSVGVG
jgi:hypothetical protein